MLTAGRSRGTAPTSRKASSSSSGWPLASKPTGSIAGPSSWRHAPAPGSRVASSGSGEARGGRTPRRARRRGREGARRHPARAAPAIPRRPCAPAGPSWRSRGRGPPPGSRAPTWATQARRCRRRSPGSFPAQRIGAHPVEHGGEQLRLDQPGRVVDLRHPIEGDGSSLGHGPQPTRSECACRDRRTGARRPSPVVCRRGPEPEVASLPACGSPVPRHTRCSARAAATRRRR
jgi:hypothetical protein